MDQKISKLRRFNIVMGTVHLIQGGLLFWLGTVVNSDFVVPITLTQLVGVGSPEDPSSFALVPELEIWTEVTNFGPAVATFLLASAVAHYLISGPFYGNTEDLSKGIIKFVGLNIHKRICNDCFDWFISWHIYIWAL